MPWSHEETGPLLDEVKASDLQPGCYCEIDMVLPPGSPENSFHCYKGTVKAVNANEVVLTDALEVGYNEYGTAARQRPPTQEKHALVQVPLPGVDKIWAFPPSKANASMPPRMSSPSGALPPGGQSVPSSPTSFSPPPPGVPGRFDSQSPTGGQ